MRLFIQRFGVTYALNKLPTYHIIWFGKSLSLKRIKEKIFLAQSTRKIKEMTAVNGIKNGCLII